MVQQFSIKNLSKEDKIELLNALGYDSDGIFVLDKNGSRVKDRYIEDLEIKLSNMLIFPGSTIILDNNPLSIAAYMGEFEGVL